MPTLQKQFWKDLLIWKSEIVWNMLEHGHKSAAANHHSHPFTFKKH